MITAGPANDALERLQAGNRRFTSSAGGSLVELPPSASPATAGQRPFAIILGCSDSRVPPEIVFDQGPGDLFVVRVAGNIAGPSQVGSVELAAEQFGTRLVVVLGHSCCGAVLATLEDLEERSNEVSANFRAIIDVVRPSIEGLVATDCARDELVRQAVRANVLASARHLHHESETITELIRDDGLRIVPAEYSLETGVVEFLDTAAVGV